jgi:hypothetical protein
VDLATRSLLVRELRCEIKQRRRNGAPAPQRTPQEERDNNFTRWMRNVDRRRPRVSNRTTPEERNTLRPRTRAYDQDRTRHGGYQVGERLREIHESGGSAGMGAEARGALARRMNTRFRSRTGFSGPDGVEVVYTPTERVNRVGTASRRRRVSAGLVPNGPRRR